MLNSCRSISLLVRAIFLSQGWVWGLCLPPEPVGGTCRAGSGTEKQPLSYLPLVYAAIKL